ncbi:MAG TPA: hypothetical protein VMN39_03685, partial [Longimicrobiaceae bacterium]|nr:hypothetical protein [Longimicrobiaceae bacterium]
MPSAPFDAKAKIEELRTLYGDIVLRPLHRAQEPRRTPFLTGLKIGAVVFLLGLVLGVAGVAGMALLDREDIAFADEVKDAQRQVDESWARLQEAEARLAEAPADPTGATAAVDGAGSDPTAAEEAKTLRDQYAAAQERKLRLVSRALSLPDQVGDVRAALLAEAAATREHEAAKAELERLKATAAGTEEQTAAVRAASEKEAQLRDALAQAQRKARETTDRLEVIPLPRLPEYLFSLSQPTSLRHFSFRSIRILSPVLITIAVLALLASLAVVIVPWVRSQAARLAEGALREASDPFGGTGRLGPIAGSALGVGSASPSLGSLAARATVMTTAAAVTVGAFTLAVPGDVIDLSLDRPPVASAGVNLGRFDVTIPGTEILVPEEKVVASFADDVDVEVPRVSVRVPNIHVIAEADLGESLARELRAYRDQQDERAQLLVAVGLLESELARRPTTETLDGLRDELRKVDARAEALRTDLADLRTSQKT